VNTRRPITIVDYGLGNLASIANMLKRVGATSTIASTPQQVSEASSIILPGVGAFDRGMLNLRERDLVEPLTRKAMDEQVPVLGLCLGMQLLVSGSEEGQEAGLGWIGGRCARFARTESAPDIRIPHMGWNRVARTRQHPLVADLGDDARFYFVHAFHLVDVTESDQVGQTVHGVRFPSIVARGNLMGVQFHPEKSHRFGMALMKAFARMSGAA
jgi:glutamine amidotransferase